MSEVLLSERVSEGIELVTLNRPDELNAVTADLATALHEKLETLAADRSCRAIVLTGAGRAFCVGLDLRGFGAAPGNDGSDDARDRLGNQEHMSRLILRLRETPQPIIAAVNGPAAGFGLALALGSDIRFAAPEAVFRAVFVNVGVSNCDMGVSWLLPRLIGASRSHELMLTGRRVRAEEAERIGLVADVVDAGELMARSLEAAEQIAAWATVGDTPDQAGQAPDRLSGLAGYVVRPAGAKSDLPHLGSSAFPRSGVSTLLPRGWRVVVSWWSAFAAAAVSSPATERGRWTCRR